MSVSISIDPDALKYILGIPRGRAVIWDILGAGGLFRTPMGADDRTTQFNLGNHNMALLVYAECMAVSPDLTSLMFKEQGNYDNGAGPADAPSSGDITSRTEAGGRDSSDEPDPGLGLGRLGPGIEAEGRN